METLLQRACLPVLAGADPRPGRSDGSAAAPVRPAQLRALGGEHFAAVCSSGPLNRRPSRCATRTCSRSPNATWLCGAGVREVAFFQSRTMCAVGAPARIEQATQEGCDDSK